ncbi:MAG TPA: nucleoside 2-deoxyribosyltransferase domain-containing protein [Ktedonosporobacter sp.]|nr:nucleoside 2-deoxyribosyltransferase domain-containing protein [Ktedonosporobacter sp.]
MDYIEALQAYNEDEPSLFLAGGITGCSDWQREMVLALNHTSLVILNPRRSPFPSHEGAAREQIIWEYVHLRKATAISFWFPKETLCPITLYELGAWSMTSKKLFVGVHPDYQRIQDVQIQTSLVRPDVQIVTSIEDLAQEIAVWAKECM